LFADIPVNEEDPMDLALLQAELLVQRGDIEAARQHIHRQVLRHPQAAPAWVLLMDLALRQQDTGLLEQYVLDLKRRPGSVVPLTYGSAYLHLMRNELPEALDAFRRLMILLPGNVVIRQHLIQLAASQGKHEEAWQQASRLLEADTEHPLANQILGVRRLQDKQWVLAEEAFRVSLSAGENPAVLNNLAWALHGQERWPEAEEIVRRALTMQENAGSIWDTLGAVLAGQGRLDEALEAFAKAVALDGTNPMIALHYAQTLQQAGRSDEARKLLSTAGEHLDDFPGADRKAFQALEKTLNR